MRSLPARRPALRWLLPVLVVLLVLGHVCDVSALGHSDAHHHEGDRQPAEQLGSCDPAPAASSSGHAQSGWSGGTQAELPAPDRGPDRAARAGLGAPAVHADRPPLFLLHAALLI